MALIRTGEEVGVPLDVLRSVEEVNRRQKGLLANKLIGVLGSDLTGHSVAVWGLAFKAQTDDMRESPAIELIEKLLAAGARQAPTANGW